MNMPNTLLVTDAVMALMELQQKYMEISQRAQLEGRDVSAADLATLAAENQARRARWDQLNQQ